VNQFIKTVIGKPAQWLIEASASIGLCFVGLTHEVTNHFVNHSIKKHGNVNLEKSRGQIAITFADIEQLPDIVKNPDYATIGKKGSNEIIIAYSKRYKDGTVVYYEDVLNSNKNKALRSKTVYKKIGTMSYETFLKIVANNGRTEILTQKRW